ncbi:MAG: DUF488 domain-containing protein [Desulfamplus sp.]|nr:DUF488 domain-containing protein [Desulfamplus sp.]
MKIFTIGFTQKNAEYFFNLIKSEKIKNMIDIRLNNVSQLSGFAKRDDLEFFLKALCDTKYIHAPELAPTKEILNSYKKKEITWDVYENRFLTLLKNRQIEKKFNLNLLEDGCLLCSEHKPDNCHRSLVLNYLKQHTDLNLNIKHLI